MCFIHTPPLKKILKYYLIKHKVNTVIERGILKKIIFSHIKKKKHKDIESAFNLNLDLFRICFSFHYFFCDSKLNLWQSVD